MNNKTIVIDAMGGDNAPQEIVEGTIAAAREFPQTNFLLVGRRITLNIVLGKNSYNNISIQDASEIIEMNEHPGISVKNKTDSSIVVAMKILRDGKAEAFFSAGNTGAIMAAAALYLGRIRGIKRPAIAVTIPTAEKPIVVIDAGANADNRPLHLLQFGIMGEVFSRKSLEVEDPKVGLLSIGEEETKGNELVIKANKLLRDSKINFFGNIEGNDIPTGIVDVVVTDGFVGNVILKLMEGTSSALFSLIKENVLASIRGKIGALIIKTDLKRISRRLDYEEYGAAPLLGVKGICLIGHGKSTPKAVTNALRLGIKMIEENFIQEISNSIKGVG